MAASLEAFPELGSNTLPPDPRMRTNVAWNSRLKRNVLEITLECEQEDFVQISDDTISRLYSTLGIKFASEVEGTFRKNNSIYVWLNNGVSLDRFCKTESIKVVPGVKTKFIRPAGKKEVTVTVTGLMFNTPDSFVMEYLGKFGNVVSKEVIYDKYKDGPFKGKFNGDRKYSVDFSSRDRAMGSFHIVDGSRVKVFYPGNKKTCARCHNTSDVCPGEGIAKQCELKKGTKILLVDHMKKLWNEIGFKPNDFVLDDNIEVATGSGDAVIKDARSFSPHITRIDPSTKDIEKYDGVTIKNFPKIAKKDIVD